MASACTLVCITLVPSIGNHPDHTNTSMQAHLSPCRPMKAHASVRVYGHQPVTCVCPQCASPCTVPMRVCALSHAAKENVTLYKRMQAHPYMQSHACQCKPMRAHAPPCPPAAGPTRCRGAVSGQPQPGQTAEAPHHQLRGPANRQRQWVGPELKLYSKGTTPLARPANKKSGMGLGTEWEQGCGFAGMRRAVGRRQITCQTRSVVHTSICKPVIASTSNPWC